MNDDNQITDNGSASDDSKVAGQTTVSLNIPDDVQQNFGELVEMIKASQSMDDEERQYWVDALPIMTEEQIQNLRNILTNERQQIEAVNNDYEEGVKEDTRQFNLEFDAAKYQEKKQMWKKMEAEQEAKEEQSEADLLKEIESMEI